MTLCRLGLHARTQPGICRECRRASCARYHAAHAASIRDRQRKRRAAFRSDIKAYRRDWYWANRERALAEAADWAAQHAEERKQYMRAYRQRGSVAWWLVEVAA